MVKWLKSDKGWKTCLIVGLIVYGANLGLGMIPIKFGEAVCEQTTHRIVTDKRSGRQRYEPYTEVRSIVPEEQTEDIVPTPHAKGPRILSSHTRTTWPKVRVKSFLTWYFYLRIDQLIWLLSVAAVVWGIYTFGNNWYQRYELRRKIEEAREEEAMRRNL